MYRLCNALRRALLVLAGVLALGTLMGAGANADEPTPRAIPAARGLPRALPTTAALPRSFSSYDAVIAYATAIAADQNALDSRLAEVSVQQDEVMSDVARGGRGRLRRLAREATQVVAAGALTNPPTAWAMPTGGNITQPFGPTRLWVEPRRTYQGVYYAHFHEGVDIAGDWMADVVAPARGRVVFVGRMLDGAEIVVLAHDGGVVTMYAHLDAYAAPPPVAAGDEVAAGQKIGTVGRTGMAYGMHLHWAAWRSGELIDPLSLIGN